jgi:hypothetical protein
MRLPTILLAATLAFCATSANGGAQSSARNRLVAVPPGAGQAERPCSSTTTFFASTALADREGWYGKHLRVLEEQPLCAPAAREVYRLTWIPTFHPSIVVRVEHDSAGYQLRAKRESGAGGYEPGKLVVDTTFRLTRSEVDELARRLKAARFWSLPTRPADAVLGTDGAQWVVEGLVSGRYNVVDRWSPSADGPYRSYRQLATWMLSRSRLVPKSLVREY